MRNEILEPNQTILLTDQFAIIYAMPRNVHSILLIKPLRPVFQGGSCQYQDWSVRLDNGRIATVMLRVEAL